MTEREQIQSAMSFLDSDSREDWIRVGMAVKSALGDGGKELWFSWSARSDKFRPRDAEAAWRSFKEGGGIGIGSLFKMAKDAGWTGTWDPAAFSRQRPRREAPPDYEKQHKEAADKARKIIAGTVWGPSAYLLDKGFQGAAARGLKQGDDLIIPMRDFWNGKPMAFQRITPNGAKKYQPFRSRVSETCYVMNKQPHADVQWWCEGYATGAAILEALRHGYRHHDQVIVCFSASNLQKLAGHAHRSRYQVTDIVIADHDWWRCNGKPSHKWDAAAMMCPECGARVTRPPGQMAARATGLPWWMPDDPGTDAADYWKEHGVDAFSKKLSQVLRDQGKTANRSRRR